MAGERGVIRCPVTEEPDEIRTVIDGVFQAALLFSYHDDSTSFGVWYRIDE